jgi:DNA-binding PadR family transcriptional regulator
MDRVFVAAARKRKPTLAGRSPLRAAVLAAVLEGPAHGYEIAVRLKKRMGPSWRIYAKHLYPILDSLEGEGLVWSEELPGEGPKRDRKVFYATPDEAERARAEWMQAPASLSLVRADVQARLIFARPEEAPLLLQMLDRYEEDVIAALEANTAVDTPRVSWRGRMLSQARASVTRRLEAERAWIVDVRRDIEEHIEESR